VQPPKKRQTGTITAVAKSHGQTVALNYSAILTTKLALMRWTRGGDIPHGLPGHPLPARAAWYDALQRNFEGWLEAGGFQGPEPSGVPTAPAADAQTDAAEATGVVVPK